MAKTAPRHGTVESQMQLAVRIADETAIKAQEERAPELTKFYYYVANAFDNAVKIAQWSRSKKKIQPAQFVAASSYLEEYLKRVKRFQEDAPNLLDKWPADAGITFSWNAGWSALDVAFKFSKMVFTEVLLARGEALGRGHRRFDDITTSGQKARKWRDGALQEVRTRTLPPPSQWPMWQINRDFESMMQKLGYEFSQATAESQSKSRRESNTTTKEVRRRPPLSDRAAAVYELLRELPEHRAMTGKEILSELDERGIYIDQSTLTKSIIPALRPYGIKNKRGIGYYISEE